MFEVKDAWNVTIKTFEDREDAEAYIDQRHMSQMWHIEEGI